jgi:hypothetical protein
MKRHGAALIVIAAVAILNLGSGSRADDWNLPGPESCKTELGFVFDWCESRAHWPCGIDDEYSAACQAGCVMYLCPEQITCTELDPMWCGIPCEDPNGATFWRNKNVAADRCEHLSGDANGDGEWDSRDFWPWQDCREAVMKERCPAYLTRHERMSE